MNIDKTLYKGRPEGARSEKELRCYELLDSLGLEYYRADHDFADTIEACEQVEKVLGCAICKNLFLTNRQETDFYLLLMPGEKPFKTKLLSEQIGAARLSFGSPEHMERLLNITPGSVSPLGLMNDGGAIRLLIDKDLVKDEWIGVHPCINSSTLRLKTADLLERVVPAMGHGLEYVELPWNPE